jgi:hypothetical protein
MKPKQKLLTVIVLCVTAAAGNAAITIQQRGSWADGNAYVAVPTVGFDIVNTSSIFIATVYTDRDTPGLTVPRFGNNGGIGSGDVAPTLTIPGGATGGGRLTSYVFVNPSTASGLSFRVNNPISGGTAIALYEVNGANTDPSTFTTAFDNLTATTSITTATVGEMVISFAGRNNAGNSTLGAGSIFSPTIDIVSAGAILGGGTINAADSIAPSIGAQNITWTNTSSVGRIAYAFEAVPEPSTALLGGLGLLVLLRRRR